MKLFKKVLAMALASALALTLLVGCGGNGKTTYTMVEYLNDYQKMHGSSQTFKAEASLDAGEDYLRDTYDEYVERRKCLIDGLNRIPGVYSPIPMGAFYTVAKLPVDDSDKFCAWCLSEFEYEGQTVFMAPASGFYTTPGSGRNEVRIAYVLKKDDLNRALFVLQKALEAYPGREMKD